MLFILSFILLLLIYTIINLWCIGHSFTFALLYIAYSNAAFKENRHSIQIDKVYKEVKYFTFYTILYLPALMLVAIAENKANLRFDPKF